MQPVLACASLDCLWFCHACNCNNRAPVFCSRHFNSWSNCQVMCVCVCLCAGEGTSWVRLHAVALGPGCVWLHLVRDSTGLRRSSGKRCRPLSNSRGWIRVVVKLDTPDSKQMKKQMSKYRIMKMQNMTCNEMQATEEGENNEMNGTPCANIRQMPSDYGVTLSI